MRVPPNNRLYGPTLTGHSQTAPTEQGVLAQPTKLFYDFGPFRLDTEKSRLLLNSQIVPLTPKAVEMLLVLIERRGQVVERDNLMGLVWPNITVEDGNLTVTISMLRKALGEDSKRNQCSTDKCGCLL